MVLHKGAAATVATAVLLRLVHRPVARAGTKAGTANRRHKGVATAVATAVPTQGTKVEDTEEPRRPLKVVATG